jgi:hypothetical protein
MRLHASAYVSIRQHMSAYAAPRRASAAIERAACVSTRQHTSAYVSIRQHTSAYVSIPATRDAAAHASPAPRCRLPAAQHTSAYLSIPQHTAAYVSIRQHTPAHTPPAHRRRPAAAYLQLSLAQMTCFTGTKEQILTLPEAQQAPPACRSSSPATYVTSSAYVSIRQHT